MINIWHLSIAYAAFVGFLIAVTIWAKKRKKQPIVCPLHFNCDAVVRSDFSTFFHVPLEYLGISYYVFTCITYVVFIFFPPLAEYRFLLVTAISLTVLAFFFSLYLTFIQLFLLKQWCSWCLMSGFLSAVIFLWTLQVPLTRFIPYLTPYDPYFLGFRIFGMVVGFACTAIATYECIRLLRHPVAAKESDMLRTLFEIIWFCLGFIMLATITLYLSIERFVDTPRFLFSLMVIVVIIISQLLLSFLCVPKLIAMIQKEDQERENKIVNLRKISFALSMVSLTSWYFAFVAEISKYNFFSFSAFLEAYVIVLLFAVGISQFIEGSAQFLNTYIFKK